MDTSGGALTYLRCGSCCVDPDLTDKGASAPAASLWFPEEGATKKGGADLVTGLEERGKVELEGGATYTGQWMGSVRHGTGVITRPDGGRYEGQFRDNSAHG